MSEWTYKNILLWRYIVFFFIICAPAIAAYDLPELSHSINTRNYQKSTCTGRAVGMELVKKQKEFGEICKPTGELVSTKIIACLSRGLEAVMVPDHDGVLCASASRGRIYLDQISGKALDGLYEYPVIRRTISELCPGDRKGSDKRLISRSFIKELIRKSAADIDPRGLRVIGGVYCEGLDLVGLDLPFSIVLDKSVFTCVNSSECDRSAVDIRNFRTKGDLSLDYIDAHVPILITRSEISGSLYGQDALLDSINVIDSTIHGSLNIYNSRATKQITVENSKVEGHVDFSRSFFSNLILIRNRMDGALDIVGTRARCSYDIRQNEIDDVIAAELGFGSVQTLSDKNEREFSFKEDIKTKENSDRFTYGVVSQKERLDVLPRPCLIPRSIVPGSFVFIGNHIGHSMCIRGFDWLSTTWGKIGDSIIYLNENVVGSATWLDLNAPDYIDLKEEKIIGPQLNIFNHKTSTYVMDFAKGTKNITVSVNGLHFDRVYSAQDKCDNALSPRATKEVKVSGQSNKQSFPPKLFLPEPNAVTTWVTRNSFKGTQPFAQFVNVFEQAGDTDAARELRIQGETISVMRSLCRAWGIYCDKQSASNITPSTDVTQRIEDRIVGLVKYTIWVLADHGYRPERIVWFVIGTIILYWIIVQLLLGIVGYSVIEDATEQEDNVVYPISIIFLFDKLIPAYQVRLDHSKPLRFYVLADAGNGNVKLLKRFFRVWEVVEATHQQQRKMLLCLDTLRWLGLIFAIFLFAAISRLVR